MLILFRLFGGEKIGFGHCYRMLAIADYLKTKKINSVFITNSEINLVSLITKQGFKVLAADNFRQLQELIKNDLLVRKIIFFDSNKDMSKEIKFLKSQNNKVVLFDNKTKARFESDINIYPTPLFQKNSLNWQGYKGKVYGGNDYLIIHKNFLLEKEKGISVKHKKNILVSFGGSDPNKLTLKVMKMISTFDLKLPIKVIVGPSFSFAEELKLLNKELNNSFELIENCSNLAPIIAESKVLITSLGITVFEAAFLDVPSIVISNYYEDQEDEKKLKKLNISHVLGYYKKLKGQNLINSLSEIINTQKTNLIKISDKAMKKVINDLLL